MRSSAASVATHKVFYGKIYRPRESQILNFLNVFLNFCIFSLTIVPNLIYVLWKQQVFESLPVYLDMPSLLNHNFWQVFVNFFDFAHKIIVPTFRLCSIEKPGFGNLLSLSGHNLLFAEKIYEFWKSFWPFLRTLDRFLETSWVFFKFT